MKRAILRPRVLPLLAPGSFLKRDANGLFVSDAPRRGGYDEKGLAELRLRLTEKDGLLYLSSTDALALALDGDVAPGSPFDRFRGMLPARTDILDHALRCLDAGKSDPPLERELRQAAAAALRTKTGGAGLCCALDILRALDPGTLL